MTQSECFPEAFHSIGRRNRSIPLLGAMKGLAPLLSLCPPWRKPFGECEKSDVEKWV